MNGYEGVRITPGMKEYVYQQLGNEAYGCRDKYPDVISSKNEIICPKATCSKDSVRNPAKLEECLRATQERKSVYVTIKQ